MRQGEWSALYEASEVSWSVAFKVVLDHTDKLLVDDAIEAFFHEQMF